MKELKHRLDLNLPPPTYSSTSLYRPENLTLLKEGWGKSRLCVLALLEEETDPTDFEKIITLRPSGRPLSPNSRASIIRGTFAWGELDPSVDVKKMRGCRFDIYGPSGKVPFSIDLKRLTCQFADRLLAAGYWLPPQEFFSETGA